MKAFKVTGTFLMGRQREKFTKEVAAEDKNAAIEHIYSVIGSTHNVKRPKIDIEDVSALKQDEISDIVIAYKVGGGE